MFLNDSWYIIVESVRNTYFAGGVVMLPILIAGVVGFYYLYASWFRIGADYFRKDVGRTVKILRESLKAGGPGTPPADRAKNALSRLRDRRGLLANELKLALAQIVENPSGFRNYMQVRMIMTVQYMEKGSHVVAVMAATAPLLGLLGTVTGMVATFQVITLYGNQNPVLMADGISEALISTQSGLLIAFPLTLLKQRLDERIELLKQQLDLGVTVMENALLSC